MLDHIDNMLRQLLISRIDDITDEAQVRFQPPDEDWRTYVGTLSVAGNAAMALNVYLLDLRENRQLRSNERFREPRLDADGNIRESTAWRRVDCHYLISAWSPATAVPGVEPTVDEHLLLYKTIAALNSAEPLVPRRVYAPDPLPAGFPQAIADAELPSTLLPAEGYPKLAEFWGTMGDNHRLKPAIYLQLTIPLIHAPMASGAMVTTRISEFRMRGGTGADQLWIEIGGHVLNSGQPMPDGLPSPVPQASVRIETLSGIRIQDARSDARGRFIIGHLAEGDYRLRAWSDDLTAIAREVRVPSPSGEYDLVF